MVTVTGWVEGTVDPNGPNVMVVPDNFVVTAIDSDLETFHNYRKIQRQCKNVKWWISHLANGPWKKQFELYFPY